MAAPTLHSERLLLRAIEPHDLDHLWRILQTPDVARWWRRHDRLSIEEWLADDDVIRWVVVLGGEVVGKIQAYEELDPEYREAGIDLFLDPAVHGHGLGREAIRCYEGVGFRRVGVLRRYWFDHEAGDWADGLLLDLLVDEVL